MEDVIDTIPRVLHKLAERLQTKIDGHTLRIPERFGTGYCTGFVFNDNVRILICNYELHEEVVLSNPDLDAAARMLFFKFQNIFPRSQIQSAERDLINAPSVLIVTSRINTDDTIAVHTNTATINIEVDANYLHRLFDGTAISPVLQSLLQNKQPLLFEQVIFPSLQNIVSEIVTASIGETFKLFFLRIKAEELICRLLMELEKRDEKQLFALNMRDVQTLYQVRNQILENLGKPPVIKNLVGVAGMSPTKLKRLFKQIFGNSIFNYYQEFRINEAARLLKDERLSVSEVGYRLGFTNLSHFTKVFEQQIGTKPKQYSSLKK